MVSLYLIVMKNRRMFLLLNYIIVMEPIRCWGFKYPLCNEINIDVFLPNLE